MKIKEYKLYKTAKKTAKENNLEYVDSFETGKRNILFDFSLLDNTDNLYSLIFIVIFSFHYKRQTQLFASAFIYSLISNQSHHTLNYQHPNQVHQSAYPTIHYHPQYSS